MPRMNVFLKPSNADWHTEDVAMISELAIQCAEGTCIATVCVYTVQTCREKRKESKIHAFSRQNTFTFLEDKPCLSIRLMQLIFRCDSSILTIHYGITEVCQSYHALW